MEKPPTLETLERLERELAEGGDVREAVLVLLRVQIEERRALAAGV